MQRLGLGRVRVDNFHEAASADLYHVAKVQGSGALFQGIAIYFNSSLVQKPFGLT